MRITHAQEKHLETALKSARAIGGRDGDERQFNIENHWYGLVMKERKWQLFEVSTWSKKDLTCH